MQELITSQEKGASQAAALASPSGPLSHTRCILYHLY